MAMMCAPFMMLAPSTNGMPNWVAGAFIGAVIGVPIGAVVGGVSWLGDESEMEN
jgi:hypothetical protein